MSTEIVAMKEIEKRENLKENSLTDKIADDWTLDNLHMKASTKLLSVDGLLEHYWSGNPKPPVYLQDGTRDLVAEGQLDDPVPSDRPRKFLIYVEYRSHRMLLTKVSNQDLCVPRSSQLQSDEWSVETDAKAQRPRLCRVPWLHDRLEKRKGGGDFRAARRHPDHADQ